MRRPDPTLLRLLIFLGGLVTVVVILIVFRKVFQPLMLGLLIAYLLDPAVGWFERRGRSRLFGVIIITLVLVIALLVAVLVVFGAGLDRLLRLSERHGWAFHRRHWTAAGIGNALLQLHVTFEPQRARIETHLCMEQPEPGGRVGDGGNDPERCKSIADNVIDIDFVRRRRRA